MSEVCPFTAGASIWSAAYTMPPITNTAQERMMAIFFRFIVMILKSEVFGKSFTRKEILWIWEMKIFLHLLEMQSVSHTAQSIMQKPKNKLEEHYTLSNLAVKCLNKGVSYTIFNPFIFSLLLKTLIITSAT